MIILSENQSRIIFELNTTNHLIIPLILNNKVLEFLKLKFTETPNPLFGFDFIDCNYIVFGPSTEFVERETNDFYDIVSVFAQNKKS